MACEAVYNRDPLPVLSLLAREELDELPMFTAKTVKYARYLCGSNNGGMTPRKRKMLDFVLKSQKEITKRRAARRKAERALEAATKQPSEKESSSSSSSSSANATIDAPRTTRSSSRKRDAAAASLPEAGPARRAKRGVETIQQVTDTPMEEADGPQEGDGMDREKGKEKEVEVEETKVDFSCARLGQVAGGNEMHAMLAEDKWRGHSYPEVWTCGMVDTSRAAAEQHAGHTEAAEAALRSRVHGDCQKLEHQLNSWKPEYCSEPWQAFAIYKDTLDANGLSVDGTCLGEVLSRLMGYDWKDEGNENRCHMIMKRFKHDRQTFFHRRFYFDYRVDTKALAKVKAATNQVYMSRVYVLSHT